MVSDAQFGEDLLAQECLGYEKSDIFYIDVGAFHPISKSNTYIFYSRGGRGICIQPNPAASSLCRRFRPRDMFIGKGVTGGESCHMAYRSNHSSAEVNHFLNHNSNSTSADLQIECVNIRQLVNDHLPSGQQVDLLSIDCEGMDVDVIRSFPFDLVRPRVVIIEDFDYSDKSEIHQLMEASGYKFVSYAKISKIFTDNQYAIRHSSTYY
jgi:FkbM family methyltransferase